MILFTSVIWDYPINFHDTEDSAIHHSKSTVGSIDVTLNANHRFCTTFSCNKCPLNAHYSCSSEDLLAKALLDPAIAAAYPELLL